MNLALVLEMVASGLGDQTAVSTPDRDVSYAELHDLAGRAADRFEADGAVAVFYLGPSHVALPVSLFGAAIAGVPFIPLNYRLGAKQLDQMVASHPGAVMVADRPPADAWSSSLVRCYERAEFLALLDDPSTTPRERPASDDTELPAVLLYTSGTTAAPKAAVLRHRHLASYLMGTVEFAGADADDATLVAVPPYHIAGLANLLTNLYAGRRIVYLENFDAGVWLDTVRVHGVTNAMVVPAMLARIVDQVGDGTIADVPTLRSLSYGGARMPASVLERAFTMFPDVGLVNAYGLTETSSTIALLGPEEHREAFRSDDPAVRARLGSVGKPLPGIEVEIRDEFGTVLPVGQVGLMFVRGEQVAGEYAGRSVLDGDGWFPTRDRGHVDGDGYLFIEGRADDTIIRGGENIAPAEIEDEIHTHPDVEDVAVVGVPDEEWGQRLLAVVVKCGGSTLDEEQLRGYVRDRLRTSKTPDEVRFRDELPRTDTGKVLRRQLVAEAVDRPA
ncbi:MAG: class I adenylate-forming enzyme family protein [Acidimicrobiales bacterium]